MKSRQKSTNFAAEKLPAISRKTPVSKKTPRHTNPLPSASKSKPVHTTLKTPETKQETVGLLSPGKEGSPTYAEIVRSGSPAGATIALETAIESSERTKGDLDAQHSQQVLSPSMSPNPLQVYIITNESATSKREVPSQASLSVVCQPPALPPGNPPEEVTS